MPEEYADDLNLKLSFQQNAMARRLSELGYAAALAEGQYLPNLLIRANPAMAMASSKDKAKANTVIYAQKCFAALQKYENAIPGLLAMAKKVTPPKTLKPLSVSNFNPKGIRRAF